MQKKAVKEKLRKSHQPTDQSNIVFIPLSFNITGCANFQLHLFFVLLMITYFTCHLEDKTVPIQMLGRRIHAKKGGKRKAS
mmetsp:Transcript_4649/g.6052  ORF Transcript_4649/g.6052 Transcript_4649/m.6052 type:complete len:81 (-) Transcript_4649:12-254(-)